MAKGRTGPALYELIRKASEGGGQGRLDTPKWWRSGPKEVTLAKLPVAKRPSDTVECAAERDAEPPVRVTQVPKPVEAAADEPVKAPAAVEFEGGRLVVSVNTVAAAAVIVGLLILVAGVFLAGRNVGLDNGLAEGYQAGRESIRAETTDEIELARMSAATDENLFGDVGDSPVTRDPRGSSPASESAKASESPDGVVEWIRGYTYIAVQDFGVGQRQAALDAQAFLRERGVDTSIVELSGNYPYRLVTTRGYNRTDPAQKQRQDAFQAQLAAMGREYSKAGGRYALKGYPVTLTQDSW